MPTRAAAAAAAALCAAGVAPTLRACRRVDASVASRAKRAMLAWQSISPYETTTSCVCASRSSPVANWIGGLVRGRVRVRLTLTLSLTLTLP